MAHPFVQVVTLSGSSEGQVKLPPGVRFVSFQARGTVTVQVAPRAGEAQLTGRSFHLVGGQPFTFDYSHLPDGTPDAIELAFFASSAETVDVVAW